MHPNQPVHQDGGAAPAASWVMGRSARWQTAEGQALLAQDPRLDDMRALRVGGVAMAVAPSLLTVLVTVWRAVRALRTLWALRREPRGR